MTPFQRRSVQTLAAGSLALMLPAVALAQDTSEMDALKKRISDLEAKLPKDTGSSASSDTMKWSEFQLLGSKWKLGGWLRLDAQYDDSRMNDIQNPTFVLSEDPTAPVATRAPDDSSEFTMHAKLTRLWLDVTGPTIAPLGDAATSGRLEVDFNNATAVDSREAIRIRVAYLQLKWTNTALYAGQMWDVISPLMPIVNSENVMWNTGNLADRRPQLRGEWWQGFGDSKLTVTAMAGQTGAIDAQDADPAGTTGKGYLDGEESGEPTLQGRVGWKKPVADSKDFEVGAWAHRATENVDVPVGSHRNFTSSAYGIDLQFPIWKKLVWGKGELWQGRDLDDVRGGIGQGINATTGDEIRSRGGWGEIGYQAAEKVTLHGGYTVDNPDNEDLATGGRSRNSALYAAVRFNFNPVLIGFEYLNWVTDYKGFDDGDTNRLVGFIQYSF